MKMPVYLVLGLLVLAPARAQIFGSSAADGVLLGGLAGGIIGHNDHNQTGRGIAIGAASGLILGSIADQARYNSYQATQVPAPSYYVYRQAPAYYYSGYTDTSYGYARPNYAGSGLLLGGLAGGIIGYNNHNQTGRGILIGAASGWLLGSIFDQAAREREATAVQQTVVVPAAAEPAAPQQNPPPAAAPPAVNNSPPSQMSGANSLFGRN
ncbi:MAG TPA: glycine zipper domain-containing protein [Opitutaceae bacterium]|jgi:hypothetical protein|nr:glycine zipper domain-containing protein [Opitutaceae bacterium]